jgi:hypothetical protein
VPVSVAPNLIIQPVAQLGCRHLDRRFEHDYVAGLRAFGGDHLLKGPELTAEPADALAAALARRQRSFYRQKVEWGSVAVIRHCAAGISTQALSPENPLRLLCKSFARHLEGGRIPLLAKTNK